MNKPNQRVERAQNPGRVNFIILLEPLFTAYEEFLPNLECLCRIQRPRKPSKSRFYDIKGRNNPTMYIVKSWNPRSIFEYCTATIRRITLSSLFARHRYLHWKFQPTVQFFAFHLSGRKKNIKMKQTCLPMWILNPPKISKMRNA